MQRRDLFKRLSLLNERTTSPPSLQLVEAGVEEHTDPLTLSDVLHLLRRMGFGATMPQAKLLVGKRAAEVVDALLGADEEPDLPSPGAWTDTATENPLGADLQTRGQIYNTWDQNWKKLGNWWLLEMANDTKAVEKLTLFWSGHWTSEYSFDETFSVPQTLYRQYKTIRKNRLTGFQKMALEMTVDNAMVNYLGGTYNEVGKPNENYARELMELFTLGIGFYTEGDVKEAARVLTGWKSSKYSDEPAPNGIYGTWFNAARHDIGAKQFMGQTISARTNDNNTEFQVKNEEIGRLIDIIFTVRADNVSRFISEKVYRYFVYSAKGEADPVIIEGLAKPFRDGGFEMRILFKKLFTSKHFFDPALRGAQIKTPVEFVVGLLRQLGVTNADPQSWTGKMDQFMLDPPNVAGWPGYRTWISTNTYPQRRQFALEVIKAMSDARANSFIKEFDDYSDVKKFIANVCNYLFPVEVTQERLDFYKNSLLGGAPDYDWPVILNTPSSSAAKFRNMLNTMAKAPDFQLC
ncbi:MAG: DUF1800 domain-containing protein [Ignavibacteria bacterium]|nr:DUF1800 domain-containing protein [Ignavibacteria bacterium]